MRRRFFFIGIHKFFDGLFGSLVTTSPGGSTHWRVSGADAILALQIYSHTEHRKNFFCGGVATTQSSGPQGSTTTTETVPEYSDVKFYRYTYRFIRTATAGNTHEQGYFS